MRVKLEWLNELVDLTGLSLEEVVNTVSLYSIEVEGVDKMVHASDIVIGHVLTKEPHPDSDHLNLLTVDVKDEVLNIVCGAPNVDKGQYVIVAKIGCELDGFTIKKSKIRGYESCGMVCSLQELGIEKKYVEEKYEKGIYYFEDKVEVGMNGAEALNLHDPVIELGLTPNRGDLLSMLGVAYEMSAVFKRPLKPLVFEIQRKLDENQEQIKIDIETPNCLSYYGQLIKNIKIKPSPRWLSSRLIAFGIRPINNSVDITNYILALFGQPLHAFDYDKVGNHIVVKNGTQDQKFITLDEQERVLSDYDVMITDGTNNLCLGGIMGGLDSEVTNETKNILLEAAVFDPATIRKTATRLNLHSEASQRYERGVDLNRTKLALDYACYLFKELCEAEIINEPGFSGVKEKEDKEIKITVEDVNGLLGTNISKEEIKQILQSLSFTVNDDLTVFVPNRRPDITIKEDLIEEVARVYGYDKLPLTHPVDDSFGKHSLPQKKTKLIRNTLLGLGLDNVVTYSLVSEQENKIFTLNHQENSENIELLMPLSEDRKILRKSLVPSLLNVMKYNFSRKIKDVNIFEISKVYYKTEGEISASNKYEKTVLAGALANEFSSTLWKGQKEIVDFYLVKGLLEQLAYELNTKFEFVKCEKESDEMHPNRTASILWNGKAIGFIGQIHPKYALENDLENVYVFELLIDELINEPEVINRYTPVNKLPNVERDIALVMKKDVPSSDVIACILKSDKQYLTNAYVFDLYEGEKINEDEKSLAIKLVFSSNEPLTEDVINGKVKRILKDLQYKLNISLRQ